MHGQATQAVMTSSYTCVAPPPSPGPHTGKYAALSLSNTAFTNTDFGTSDNLCLSLNFPQPFQNANSMVGSQAEVQSGRQAIICRWPLLWHLFTRKSCISLSSLQTRRSMRVGCTKLSLRYGSWHVTGTRDFTNEEMGSGKKKETTKYLLWSLLTHY